MSVQEGHQYPNVVRILADDSAEGPWSEYWYYDNGGAYPWPDDAIAPVWFNPAGSNTAPYDTKAKGATLMSTVRAAVQPGQNAILSDGTYNSSSPGWDIDTANYLWHFNVGDSGDNGNSITYRAETDGGVTLDSLGVKNTAVFFDGVNDLDLHGFVLRNGLNGAVNCSAGNVCARIGLYRVSAWNGHTVTDANHHLYGMNDVTDLVMEDCAGGGSGERSVGRNIFLIFNCTNPIIRRLAGIHNGYRGTSFGAIGQVYNTTGAVLENVIGTHVPPAIVEADEAAITGFNNWGNSIPATNNSFKGCVMWDLSSDNTLVNAGGFNDDCNTDIIPPGNINVTYENMVVVNVQRQAYGGDGNFTDWGDGTEGTYYDHCVAAFDNQTNENGGVRIGSIAQDNGAGQVFKNSVVSNAWAGLDQEVGPTTMYNSYNCLWNCANTYWREASAGVGEITTDPGYDTTTFDKGAYLMRPAALNGLGEGGADMGADVRYRIVDGVTTADPLWPWPMEDRIAAESGFSVTYSTDPGGSAASNFIGIWKTLAGVYP